MIKSINLTDGSVFCYTTIEVLLDGVKQTIVPMKSEFSMASQVKAQDQIYQGIKADMLLPTVMCFCEPEIFRLENKPLFTLNGRQIPLGVSLEEKVLVYLDKADNVQLLGRDELGPINAEIVPCRNVKDAVAKMAATSYVSQVPTKLDWMGFAGAADITAAEIKKFADKYRISGKVAQAYFGVKVKTSLLQSAAIYGNQGISPERSKEHAVKLLEAVAQAFGAKNAGQARYLKGVNYCINQYGWDRTIKALEKIGGKEKLLIEVASCEDKAECLQNLLTTQIIELQSVQPDPQAESMTNA